VTCQSVICQNAHSSQICKQEQTLCRRGCSDVPAPMPKSDDSLNMSRVIFRSIECTLISEETLVFIEIEEQLIGSLYTRELVLEEGVCHAPVLGYKGKRELEYEKHLNGGVHLPHLDFIL
jgi:hypothetical protein